MNGQSTTNALGTKVAIEELERCDVDPKPLLEQAGLDPEATYDATLSVPFDQQSAFFELAAKATGNDFLGIRIARMSNPFELGALSYVSQTSATFGHALSNFRRYLKLITDADELEFRFEGDKICVVDVRQSNSVEPGRQITDCGALYFVQFCRRIAGESLMPSEVRLSYDYWEDPSEHAALFNCPVSFGHEEGQILFKMTDLTRVLNRADTHLHKILTSYCDALLHEKDERQPDFAATVQDIVTKLLPARRANAADVAKELGFSERTLQRRLADDGTNFRQVRELVKRSLAQKYLQESDESIAHIAYILDFSSQSSFSASFQRLNGKNPDEVRRAKTSSPDLTPDE